MNEIQHTRHQHVEENRWYHWDQIFKNHTADNTAENTKQNTKTVREARQ